LSHIPSAKYFILVQWQVIEIIPHDLFMYLMPFPILDNVTTDRSSPASLHPDKHCCYHGSGFNLFLLPAVGDNSTAHRRLQVPPAHGPNARRMDHLLSAANTASSSGLSAPGRAADGTCALERLEGLVLQMSYTHRFNCCRIAGLEEDRGNGGGIP
jgi:hypothetical protein